MEQISLHVNNKLSSSFVRPSAYEIRSPEGNEIHQITITSREMAEQALVLNERGFPQVVPKDQTD